MYKELYENINKSFENSNEFKCPTYTPEKHVLDLTASNYWNAILQLRHVIRLSCDEFFAFKKGAVNIDLFMITPSVSSPMGPGSDSDAIPIKFGKFDSYLVDSSQFGFEPIMMNDFNLLYCYLPSMRGEDYDHRHLNQFFHCEAELRGNLEDVMRLVEDFIKSITNSVYQVSSLLECLSDSPENTFAGIRNILDISDFKKIEFEDAVKILEEGGLKTLINYTDHGRDISSEGEKQIALRFSPNAPFWITKYDRSRVPFYQKPDPNNPGKTLNADLIFPPLIENSFGGEIVGCGQRQDKSNECVESLILQGLDPKGYEWYIKLRDMKEYRITSGFGVGIERYITWLLCKNDIKNVIPYPRLKNVQTYP